MASAVDICNMALSHVGSDAIVTSIDPADGSVESGHCARFYPQARTELLDSHAWSFSKRRAVLAQVTNPSAIWAYAYTLPSNCVSPLRVLNSFTLQSLGFQIFSGLATPSELALVNEYGSADFEIETAADGSAVLLTHEPEAVLLYTLDVTDPSRFPPSFITTLSYLLASFLAGPLIKGSEGASTGAKLRQAARDLGRDAAVTDANASSEPSSQLPDSIRARL